MKTLVKTIDELQQDYENLPDDMKQDLSWWIRTFIQPAKRFNHLISSYGLKHLFEAVVREYVTNDQFKGAMLKAGYSPYDPAKLNWYFKIYKVSLHSDVVSFYDWCIAKYKGLDNAAGDLARDMSSDGCFPSTVAEKSVILNYLFRRGACEAAIDTFQRVWGCYESEVLNQDHHSR